MRPQPLGDPVPELKERLAQEIVEVMEGWTQWNAAVLLGTDQPRVSDLRQGKLERFSLEQLMRMLARINRRVDVTIVPTWRHSWLRKSTETPPPPRR